MSKLRSVDTHFWNDNYVIGLDPVDKLIFLYLLTNAQTNTLGAYEIHIKKVAFDTGNPLERVRKAFKAFEKDKKIAYIDGFVILKNFMKHQNLNTNMQRSAITSFNKMPPQVKQHPFCKPLAKALKGFIKASESLRKDEYEVEYEYEVEREVEIESESKKKPYNAREENSEMVFNCPIPEPLLIDGFKDRYKSYWDYLKQTRQMQPSIQSVESQYRRLIELKNKGNPPLEVIDQTMRDGNKALYPLKDKQFKSDGQSSRNSNNGKINTDKLSKQLNQMYSDN
jgi:vacuolar-type H+-ATPase subunit I/STV1